MGGLGRPAPPPRSRCTTKSKRHALNCPLTSPVGEDHLAQAWGGPRYAYTGQIQLPEIGLDHYKARAYDPSAGRFMQTDPVGYKSYMDLYAYAKEDPPDNSDPMGTDVVTYNSQQKTTIANRINLQTDGRFRFDETNHLRHNVEGPPNSKKETYFTHRLIQAIQSPRTMDTEIKPGRMAGLDQNHPNRVTTLDKCCGGGATLSKPNGDQTVYVSGNLNNDRDVQQPPVRY